MSSSQNEKEILRPGDQYSRNNIILVKSINTCTECILKSVIWAFKSIEVVSYFFEFELYFLIKRLCINIQLAITCLFISERLTLMHIKFDFFATLFWITMIIQYEEEITLKNAKNQYLKNIYISVKNHLFVFIMKTTTIKNHASVLTLSFIKHM